MVQPASGLQLHVPHHEYKATSRLPTHLDNRHGAQEHGSDGSGQAWEAGGGTPDGAARVCVCVWGGVDVNTRPKRFKKLVARVNMVACDVCMYVSARACTRLTGQGPQRSPPPESAALMLLRWCVPSADTVDSSDRN